MLHKVNSNTTYHCITFETNYLSEVFLNTMSPQCALGAMTALPSLSVPRWGPACTLQGNNLIVSGGADSSRYHTLVEQLDLK